MQSVGFEAIVDMLEFHKFVHTPDLPLPSREDLDSVSVSHGRQHAANILADYFESTSDQYKRRGIRPGCVLRLKTGGHLLVGHISEHMGYTADAPFVALDEIEAIAYLY